MKLQKDLTPEQAVKAEKILEAIVPLLKGMTTGTANHLNNANLHLFEDKLCSVFGGILNPSLFMQTMLGYAQARHVITNLQATLKALSIHDGVQGVELSDRNQGCFFTIGTITSSHNYMPGANRLKDDIFKIICTKMQGRLSNVIATYFDPTSYPIELRLVFGQVGLIPRNDFLPYLDMHYDQGSQWLGSYVGIPDALVAREQGAFPSIGKEGYLQLLENALLFANTPNASNALRAHFERRHVDIYLKHISPATATEQSIAGFDKVLEMVNADIAGKHEHGYEVYWNQYPMANLIDLTRLMVSKAELK